MTARSIPVNYSRSKIVIGTINNNGDEGDVGVTNPLPVAIVSGGAGTELIGKVSIDQTTPGTTDSVSVKSTAHSATVIITRPTDTNAYLAGDVIGDTSGSAIFTFANMCRASGGEIIITSVEFELDVATSGIGPVNLRLYNASPAAIADNAAWDLVAGDRGKYLGKINLTTPIDEGNTLFCDNDGINKQVTMLSGNLYVELQTVAGFTPASASVKRLTIHTLEV